MILVNEVQHKAGHMDISMEHLEPRKRVLIVEDDLTYRPMWEHILLQIHPSLRLDWAQSEEQAERLINKHIINNLPYDLIIADVFLSGKRTGVDLWEKYGDWSSHFIFVSGMPRETFEDLMSQGYSAPLYLQKPLRAKLCKQILNDLIGNEIAD